MAIQRITIDIDYDDQIVDDDTVQTLILDLYMRCDSFLVLRGYTMENYKTSINKVED